MDKLHADMDFLLDKDDLELDDSVEMHEGGDNLLTDTLRKDDHPIICSLTARFSIN